MNLEGKTIANRYEIIESVGKGGMATVYKAKDHVLNRFVAVKVLKDEFTTDAEFIKRFNTEAQSAAILTHPNIVSIYDVGYEEENNLYYIVMELIKGKTLKEIINKDGKISWKWAVNIAIQMASALEKAHDNNIIHRDIKPHNIIITEDGTAKVTDFGIAKAVSNSTITAFGQTIGSVHYFSPEQAKGGVTDAKSDLYSLGVVLYEMVTGKVPFDADTPVSVALKHMQEEPVPPIEINKDVPEAINDIILKAMQKEPRNRYQTATEMLGDLSKALKDPDGDFVVIENKDGGYTRVMHAVTDDDIRKSKASKKTGLAKFFALHPGMKIPAIGAGLLVIFLFVFLLTRLVTGGFGDSGIQIPDLSGKTLEEAQKTMNELKLTLVVGDAEASNIVEEGKILKQEPPYQEGKKLKAGEKITIHISKGPETADLPDFVGKKIDDVKKECEKMGLTVQVTEENHNEVEEGKVFEQSIKAGEKVKSGDVIAFKVSKGKKKVTVPTVIGMNEGTATATLSNAGLKSEVAYANEANKEDGSVLYQSVEQGKEIEEGTVIKITVNKIEKKKVTITYKVPKAAEANTTTNSESGSTVSKTVNIEVQVEGGNSYTENNVQKGTTFTKEIEGSGTKTVTLKITDGSDVKTKTKSIDFNGPESVLID